MVHPGGANPNDKTVVINPPGAYHNGGAIENLTPGLVFVVYLAPVVVTWVQLEPSLGMIPASGKKSALSSLISTASSEEELIIFSTAFL